MGRQATGWFNRKLGRWLSRAGPISAKTGKPTRVILRDELGRPIAENDIAGRDAAIARLLAARDGKYVEGPDEVAAYLRRILGLLAEMVALREQQVQAASAAAEARNGPGRLLTVDDLAARWKCEPATVMEMVRSRKVPYVQVGNKKRLDQRGPKDLRFRLAAVEAWEADAEMVWITSETIETEKHKADAQAAAFGWDGIDRLKGRGASGPRGSSPASPTARDSSDGKPPRP